MKTQSEIQVKHDLDQCVTQMKNLLKQMEPAQRLAFINELTIQLMPSRKKASSSSEKINARMNSSVQGLSKAQMQLIKKVSDDTDRLFDFDSDHRA
ncbi:MAG: hypothetical protein IPK10_09595 [Bacteroidetes bacterium]|nr:hypothetical protein [Bacteroidota bacterium]